MTKRPFLAVLTVSLVGVVVGVGLGPASADAKSRPASKAPIEIGFDLTGNAGASEQQVVGSTTTYTSGKPYDLAISKWVTAHGGLGGRPVKAVFFADDFNSPTNFQNLCVTYFQNNHIFADVPFAQNPSEFPCFQKNGAILMGGGGTKAVFARYAPSLWSPGGMPLDVYLKNYAIDVLKSHWIKKGAKVGLIYSSDASVSGPVQKTVVPYLRSHGVRLTDSAEAPSIQNTASFVGTQVPTKNTVLRFKTEGITQVLVPDWGDLYNFLIWLRYAEPQSYYPAFAFGNNVIPGGNVKTVALYKGLGTRFYRGSMIVADSTSSETSPPTYPVIQTCHDIYASEGAYVPTQVASIASTAAQAYSACEDLLFLKQVMAKGNITSLTAFRRAADTLGTRIDAEIAGAPHASLTSQRRYAGGHEIQDLAYRASCTCFEVTKPFHPVLGY